MPDYEEMYKTLFRLQTMAISILQEAQKMTEEMYISAEDGEGDFPPEGGAEALSGFLHPEGGEGDFFPEGGQEGLSPEDGQEGLSQEDGSEALSEFLHPEDGIEYSSGLSFSDDG